MSPTTRSLPWGLVLWTALVTVFILGPLVLVLVVSFTPLDYIGLGGEGWSLRWYRTMLERPELMRAAVNSLWLACIATVVSLLLGIPAALVMARHAFRGRDLLHGVLMSPLFVPLILAALALLSTYSAWGWTDQRGRMLAAHVVLTLPYVVRTLTASLAAFDARQELAARNLGASRWQAFRLVTLPQLAPGIFAGALFAFIVSFDDIGLSLFLTGAGFMTLPVQLFSYAAYESDPTIAAVSVTMVALSFLTVILVERVFGLERLMR